ncbi:hypothetical protein AUH73_03105 [archaeon 13_1_40CM_4_53_4]|nr:MAG: hypothetical protein AUH73_03105 [archaeon 13_1_40CM_4_53_4]
MVIGRRGQSIKDLTKLLETKFGIENAQLSVAAIEIPEQDPKVVASQVAQALQRGVHFRRSAYWAIQRVMESQALGVEIIIRGKLTTERARYEKFRAGYLPRVGDPVLKSVKVAVTDVQLKQGLFGIKVRILPPNINFVDKPTMKLPRPRKSKQRRRRQQLAILRKREIGQMLPEEREKKVSELRAELTTIRTQVNSGGTVDNPARVRELRRAIARLLTAQNLKAPTEKA